MFGSLKTIFKHESVEEKARKFINDNFDASLKKAEQEAAKNKAHDRKAPQSEKWREFEKIDA